MALPQTATVLSVADETRGQEIRRRREHLGVSQADLGQRVGVNEQTIRNIEKGNNSKAIPRVFAVLDQLERSPAPRTATANPSDSPTRQALNAAVGDDEVYELRVRMIRGVRVVEFIATGRDTSQEEIEAVIAEIRH